MNTTSASSAKPNENYSFFWQNAFGFTLPKKAVVRAISGLATARYSPGIQIR
jgi:hypothetical protein